MAPFKTILICDDDQGMRDTIAAILKRDYRVQTVSSGEAALALLKEQDVDLILLDVRLPGISGFDVLRIVKENYSLVECIMISAINEVETAVQAMKHGAYHYITKNFDYDELRSLVRNACERQDLNRQVITLSAQVAEQSEREFLIGPSRQIRDIVDLVTLQCPHMAAGLTPERVTAIIQRYLRRADPKRPMGFAMFGMRFPTPTKRAKKMRRQKGPRR